jgi:hypothetical protein
VAVKQIVCENVLTTERNLSKKKNKVKERRRKVREKIINNG